MTTMIPVESGMLYVLTLDGIIVGVYDRLDDAQVVALGFGLAGAWEETTDEATGSVCRSAPCRRSLIVANGREELCETWTITEVRPNARPAFRLSSMPMVEVFDYVGLQAPHRLQPRYHARVFSEVIAGRDVGRQQESSFTIPPAGFDFFRQSLLRDGFSEEGAPPLVTFSRRRTIPEDCLDILFRLPSEACVKPCP